MGGNGTINNRGMRKDSVASSFTNDKLNRSINPVEDLIVQKSNQMMVQ
jgi:hypothetical protein